jgi:hypothetical protein
VLSFLCARVVEPFLFVGVRFQKVSRLPQYGHFNNRGVRVCTGIDLSEPQCGSEEPLFCHVMAFQKCDGISKNVRAVAVQQPRSSGIIELLGDLSEPLVGRAAVFLMSRDGISKMLWHFQNVIL